MLRLTNIRLADGSLSPDLDVIDGKDSYEERDMSGLTAFPGFFDSHIHGSFGLDVSDGRAEDVIKLATLLPSFGVTGFLPTLMSLSESGIMKAAEAISQASEGLLSLDCAYAGIAGLRLEGPLLSPDKAGVQNSDNLIGAEEFAKILDKLEKSFPGLVRMIDLAPELNGAMDLVREYKDRYVFSLGHSGCSYEKAAEFLKDGGNSLTHALNAMNPCLKRNPGPLGAAFDSKDSYIEVICDGIHIDPTVLRMLFSLFEDRIIVISDAMRASGMPDGIYDIGGTDVESRGGRTYFGPEGNLAGSVTNMAQEAQRLFAFGIPVPEIIKAMTVTPGKRLKINNGGLSGDPESGIAFMDKEMRLMCVISRGRLVSPGIML